MKVYLLIFWCFFKLFYSKFWLRRFCMIYFCFCKEITLIPILKSIFQNIACGAFCLLLFLDAERKSNIFKRRSKFFSCGAFSLLLIYEMTWKSDDGLSFWAVMRQSKNKRVRYQQLSTSFYSNTTPSPLR